MLKSLLLRRDDTPLFSPKEAMAELHRCRREDRATRVRSLGDARAYLFVDLRLDRSAFLELDGAALEEIARALGSRKALLCAKLLQRMKEGR